MVVVEGNNRDVVVVERNNRNVLVVVVERKQWKCGGCGKTTEMWWWLYIVSLFTKLC